MPAGSRRTIALLRSWAGNSSAPDPAVHVVTAPVVLFLSAVVLGMELVIDHG